MRYVFLSLVTIGVMTYALIDCVRTDDARVRLGLPHWFWVVIILLLPLAGAVTWLVVSNLNRRRYEGGEPQGPSRPRPPDRPLAPDDDPDFLWRLDQQRRRGGAPAGPAEPTPPTGSLDDTAEPEGSPPGDHDEPKPDERN